MNEKRKELVDDLKQRGYIESAAVEQAFLAVPREEFVPEEVRDQAYRDTPLSIGEGQTISAPHMVATITELLELQKDQEVLEIGAGRGYHAAVTAEIVGAGNVTTVERNRVLGGEARDNLRDQGYGDVQVVIGDGSKGYLEGAPYDRIYLTCAAPSVPDPLADQVRNGGRMVLPVGRGTQTLYVVDKRGDELRKEGRMAVRFVRLVGEEGF